MLNNETVSQIKSLTDTIPVLSDGGRQFGYGGAAYAVSELVAAIAKKAKSDLEKDSK